MSAFSRGLGLALSQRIFSCAPKTIPAPAFSFSQRSAASISFSQAMRNSPILQAARKLQTSARLCASKPKPKPKPTTPTSAPYAPYAPAVKARPNPSSLPNPVSVPNVEQWNAKGSLIAANRLSQVGEPTILYESPSHFWFHFFSIVTAIFCVTYALMHYYWYVYRPPQDVASWVPGAYGFICLAMFGMGIYFIMGTSGIVRRITAIPKNLVPKLQLQHDIKGLSPKVAHAREQMKNSPVVVEVTMSHISDMLSTKKVLAAPPEVWLAVKMQNLVDQRAALDKAEAATKIQPDPVKDTLLDKIADGIRNMWLGAKRALSKGGFLPIKVNGEEYKLDINPGAKVCNDIKLVDRLLPAYPERFDKGALSKFYNK